MENLRLLGLIFPLITLNIKPIYAEEMFPSIRQEIPKELVENFIDNFQQEEVEIEEEVVIIEDIEEEEVFIEEEIDIQSVSYNIPEYPGMKKWMSYKAFSKTSKQAQLQQLAHTDGYGCRLVEQRYCVALGTHYGAEIGQYIDLVLENGAVIPCILSDVKAPQHTDPQNIFSNTNKNLCASEFVVDPNKLKRECKASGDMSKLYIEWESPVSTIIKYNTNILQEEKSK